MGSGSRDALNAFFLEEIEIENKESFGRRQYTNLIFFDSRGLFTIADFNNSGYNKSPLLTKA